MGTEPEIDDAVKILDEDNELVIVSKSGNCPIHEGGLYKENCLTHLLEKKYGFRLYPVYRLDRETSGIVVFSKKRDDVKKISDSISYKEYIAICIGNVKAQTIDSPIGEVKGDFIKWKKAVSEEGKKAVTEIISSEKIGKFSLIRIVPKTGRQHQIRVHLNHIGNPIIGDKIYGESDKLFKEYLEGKENDSLLIKRQALHLAKIIINGKEIKNDIPEDMKELINKMKE